MRHAQRERLQQENGAVRQGIAETDLEHRALLGGCGRPVEGAALCIEPCEEAIMRQREPDTRREGQQHNRAELRQAHDAGQQVERPQ